MIVISIGAFTFFGSSNTPDATNTQPIEGSSSPAINPHLAAMRIQRSAQESVEAQLRDPSSAEFQNQNGFCGEVNSKNALGEYTGFQRYIAAGTSVVLERDSGLPASEFAKVWALCDR